MTGPPKAPVYVPPAVGVPDRTPALDPLAPPVEHPPEWAAFAWPLAWGMLLTAGAGLAITDGAWPLVPVGVAWLGGIALIGFRLVWLVLARKRALALWTQYRAYLYRAWDVDLTARERGYLAERTALAGWLERMHGKPPAPPDPVVNLDAQIARAVALHSAAQLPELEALLTRVLGQAAPESRARVTPPDAPAEAETQPLTDPAALLAAAYLNGPVRMLVQRARAGKPISHDALTEGAHRLMSDQDWRDGCRVLGRAGIFLRKGQGPTAPWILASELQSLDDAALDRAVVAKLAAAGCVCADIPGDLQD